VLEESRFSSSENRLAIDLRPRDPSPRRLHKETGL
jgi:hypothetical protein